MQRIYIAVCAMVSAAALLTTTYIFDIKQIGAALGTFDVWSLLGVSAALLIGAMLASVRLRFIAADMGLRLNLRDAVAALAAGQIAGALTIQLFGQIAARGMVLERRGLSLPTNIVISVYERLVALAVGATLAIAGAWSLFGKLAIDMAAGGQTLTNIVVGLFGATIGGALVGWREHIGTLAAHVNWRRTLLVLRSGILTVAIHGSTAAAYVLAAHTLAPEVPLASMTAAALVVMFAASLPISLAGWGIREISAVFAFSAVGVPADAAVAISIVIGIASLAMVALIGGATVFVGTSGRRHEQAAVPPIELAQVVAWTVPLIAATIVPFQLHVPTASGVINANPADLLALLGGILFAADYVKGRRPQWRVPGFGIHLLTMAAALLIALLIGISRFGPTQWALVNKGLGFLVLLGYFGTGALIVIHAGERGRVAIILTFVGAVAGILATLAALVAIDGAPLQIIHELAQNRNAFSFVLVIVICLVAFLDEKVQVAVLGLCFLGLLLGASRTGATCAVIVLACSLWLRELRLRTVVLAALVAASAFLLLSLKRLDSPTILIAVQPDIQSSNVERLHSLVGGWNLFLNHPIFGAGLGAFMDAQTRIGHPLVIHSSPLWIAAEMGLLGLIVFGSAAVRLFLQVWGEDAKQAHAILLVVIAFGVFSSVHELTYQRSLWLIAGALLVGAPFKRAAVSASASGQPATR